jgi:repressor LexA
MADDKDYLHKLQDYYASHRVLPSYATMGNLLGLRSKSSVAALVARLKLAGMVESAPDKRLKPTARFFERPLAESVRAGIPHPAGDASSDALTIDEYLIERPSRTVLITVKGDSMIDAGIQEGDIVVVERAQSADTGQLVVAIVDDEFTLKMLQRDKAGFVLQPANRAYAPLRPKGALEIYGVVVGLIRKYN